MKKYLLLLSAVSMIPISAHANDYFQQGKLYGSIGAGIALPQSTSVSLSGGITGSGDINYKDGAAYDGMLGYHFSDFFAGEAELAYSSVDYDNISGTLTGGALGAGSGDIGVDGQASAFIGLLNGIVTPFNAHGISPYFGGGLGFASTKTSISSVSFGGTTSAVNSSDSQTDFAADGLAGFDISISNGFSLGGRYQYLWINSKSSDTSSGVTEDDGNFSANVFTAQATLKF